MYLMCAQAIIDLPEVDFCAPNKDFLSSCGDCIVPVLHCSS